jgi:hypothetical protein
LAGGKLHKTQIKENTGLTCKPARVKGIGPGMSEVSDVTALQISFYDERMGRETDSERVCRLCYLSLGISVHRFDDTVE